MLLTFLKTRGERAARGGCQGSIRRKGRDAPASLLAVLRDGGAGRGFVLHPRPANCGQVQPLLRSSGIVRLKERRKASSTSAQLRRNLVLLASPSPHLRRGQHTLHGRLEGLMGLFFIFCLLACFYLFIFNFCKRSSSGRDDAKGPICRHSSSPQQLGEGSHIWLIE